MTRHAASSVFGAASAVYAVRRRVATALAVFVGVMFGYHAVFGQNGIIAYAKKRDEDKVLAAQVRTLSEENTRLHDRVAHLRSDADTVEMEARQRLHYTRSGEVIYTLNKPMDSGAAPDKAQAR